MPINKLTPQAIKSLKVVESFVAKHPGLPDTPDVSAEDKKAVKAAGMVVLSSLGAVNATGTPTNIIDKSIIKLLNDKRPDIVKGLQAKSSAGALTPPDAYEVLHKVIVQSGIAGGIINSMMVSPEMARRAWDRYRTVVASDCGFCGICAACGACGACAGSLVLATAGTGALSGAISAFF